MGDNYGNVGHDVGWSCKPCLKVLRMFVVVWDGVGSVPG